MDSRNAIEIRNVTKSFKIEIEDPDKKGTFLNKNPKKTIINTVLNDISLDIRKGDVLGVLGRNGSGKSTFLSMIARIMEPDAGTIERSGKIASILELGMGFHIDMSGRENIYLKGELYGFSRAEMDTKVEKIIDYSGIRKYIDNPVRTYSSGMSGRLAFAIMINIESQIMLVDEILSVGDAGFASKAKEHFKKLAKSGKTVIFVSHSINDVSDMCNRCIWIENGKIVRDGAAKTVCAEYLNKMSSSPEIVSDLAIAGVPESQYQLALMYKEGTSEFGKSEELYQEWLKKASDQGHTFAQVAYADICIDNGDIEEAITLYKSAANKGNNDAKLKISFMKKGKNELDEKIKEIFLKMAQSEDPINMFKCAEYLLKTAWTDADKKEAYLWFEKSAAKGYPNAMHQVGLMQRDGLGVVRDFKKMTISLENASEKGYLPSIILMADIYLQGRIVPRNEKKAFDLYLKGAELGNGKCQYQVATMYQDGIGTDVNLTESDKWFEKFSHSTTILDNMRAADWAKIYGYDKDLVKKIYCRCANCGNAVALENIVYMEASLEEDSTNALNELKILAKKGNLDATERLGNLYFSGVGVSKNYTEALHWYLESASINDQKYYNRIGEMYRDGRGTEINPTEAYNWFTKQAVSGNAASILNILDLYSARILEQDTHFFEYLEMLKNLANSGNVYAARKLGEIYRNGLGPKRDFNEAKRWYEKAIRMGDVWSQNRLQEMR